MSPVTDGNFQDLLGNLAKCPPSKLSLYCAMDFFIVENTLHHKYYFTPSLGCHLLLIWPVVNLITKLSSNSLSLTIKFVTVALMFKAGDKIGITKVNRKVVYGKMEMYSIDKSVVIGRCRCCHNKTELLSFWWNCHCSLQPVKKKSKWHVYFHYSDVIMSTRASQITCLTIVYWAFCSDADQRKHQSSTSLAFVRGIHRWPVNSPHKGPVTQKMFLFDDVVIVHAWR